MVVPRDCAVGDNGVGKREGDYQRLVLGLVQEVSWNGKLVQDGSEWFGQC